MTENQTTPEMEQPTEETRKKGFRWQFALIWALLLAFLIIVGVQLVKRQKGTVQVGEVAPTFTLYTFDGEVITPEDLEGKVVVVNFWASWCTPCEAEAAELEEAWQYYKDRGDVIFLGIAYTDSDQGAAGYISRFGITYPNGHDLETAITQAYRTRGVPETYIIDVNGVLDYIKIGPFASLSEIKAAVDYVIENPYEQGE